MGGEVLEHFFGDLKNYHFAYRILRKFLLIVALEKQHTSVSSLPYFSRYTLVVSGVNGVGKLNLFLVCWHLKYQFGVEC